MQQRLANSAFIVSIQGESVLWLLYGEEWPFEGMISHHVSFELHVKMCRWKTKVHGVRTYRELQLLRYMREAWPTAAPRADDSNEDDEPTFQHQQIVALLDAFVATTSDDDESL